jgi:hypothetical protein
MSLVSTFQKIRDFFRMPKLSASQHVCNLTKNSYLEYAKNSKNGTVKTEVNKKWEKHRRKIKPTGIYRCSIHTCRNI